MFFSKRRLSLLLTTVFLVALVTAACGNGASAPVTATVAAPATTTVPLITDTPIATPIPDIFPEFPEFGLDANGGVVITPNKSGAVDAWPSKVLVSSTSVYAWMKCHGHKPIEVYATLELSEKLPNFELLRHPACMGGLLLIISGTQANYNLSWGEGATILGKAVIYSVVDMEVTKFEVPQGTTEISPKINPDP